ncbi:hypothetical protein O4215_10845 [Rhodococcus maanshanensis]|nr:hypothetical protein [Rhodococcus maanshanensis]MCZ4556074.1 hypothetical protein [Rhodococcus maanshanensis]
MLRKNYDVVATIGTAGVLLIVSAPWPLWLVWTGIVGYLATNRLRHRHA